MYDFINFIARSHNVNLFIYRRDRDILALLYINI